MKIKSRRVPEDEYFALLYKVMDAGLIAGGHLGSYGTKFAMIDSDFLPTQNMAEVRYMAWDNAHDCGLFQVDSTGTAILLLRYDE